MTVSVTEALTGATASLTPVIGAEAAAREARLLMQAATGWSAASVIVRGPDAMAGPAHSAFIRLVTQRIGGMSVAHITGRTDFFGHSFCLRPGDLAPRPDTETLVELALAEPFERLLDLGTGTGVIAISLLAARPGTTGIACDLSEEALQSARLNTQAHGLADRLSLVVSDWFAGIGGTFDLIVSNPPYVDAETYRTLAREIRLHERPEALTPGGDGLDAYRVIARGAPAHLVPGGRLLVEIGFEQGEAVAALFAEAGLRDVSVHTDLSGKDRVVVGLWPDSGK